MRTVAIPDRCDQTLRQSTYPVHVHEVHDGHELAVQGVAGQVDQADAPELDVALLG